MKKPSEDKVYPADL